ncbi:hypothetical protein DV736_g3996, partial [Chaetothyriales sp. CBS 134916]
MKLVLSTSQVSLFPSQNIVSSGPALLRRPPFSKSNVELIDALHSNFAAFWPLPHSSNEAGPAEEGAWTAREGDTLYVPSWQPTPLAEPREAYDITAKLFYLPGVPSSRRCRHTSEAIDLVLKELGVDSIDLLIVSYPGVSFDADDEADETDEADEADAADAETHSGSSDESEAFDAQIQTWHVLESLHTHGTIKQLGLSEFSSERLQKFLPEVATKPAVDQINIKDCCVVPKSLIVFAKAHQIELLTHADCTDILPPGTLRELLGVGDKGAGLLAARADAAAAEPGLKGDIEPQWVIKYTAVVKNRGVIENKGYFAVAQLGSCIET